MTVPLVSKVQNKVSTSWMFLTKLICYSVFTILSVCECSTFSFVNGIFKTQKLNSPLEACFLLRAVLDLLWRRDIYFYKLFLINKIKNTQYLNNDYTNVIKFTKIQHITGRKHKCRKTKNSFPKKWVENPDLY